MKTEKRISKTKTGFYGMQNYINVMQNTVDFRYKDIKLKVTFSRDDKAPTMENALVNIAIRRSG